MPFDIGSMNPQQLQFLVSLLSRGGQQQGLPGLPGLPGAQTGERDRRR